MRPYDFPEAYSRIILGTTPSPGTVTLTAVGRPKNWNIQRAKGSTGASTSLEGDDPGEFTADFYLADDSDGSQFNDWEVFQRLLESTVNGPTPKALPVYHPDLARAGYSEVTLKGISGPVHDGRGGATYTVQFLEFLPPKPKPPRKPKAAPPSDGSGEEFGPPLPDPNREAKERLAALVDQASEP